MRSCIWMTSAVGSSASIDARAARRRPSLRLGLVFRGDDGVALDFLVDLDGHADPDVVRVLRWGVVRVRCAPVAAPPATGGPAGGRQLPRRALVAAAFLPAAERDAVFFMRRGLALGGAGRLPDGLGGFLATVFLAAATSLRSPSWPRPCGGDLARGLLGRAACAAAFLARRLLRAPSWPAFLRGGLLGRRLLARWPSWRPSWPPSWRPSSCRRTLRLSWRLPPWPLALALARRLLRLGHGLLDGLASPWSRSS